MILSRESTKEGVEGGGGVVREGGEGEKEIDRERERERERARIAGILSVQKMAAHSLLPSHSIDLLGSCN